MNPSTTNRATTSSFPNFASAEGSCNGAFFDDDPNNTILRTRQSIDKQALGRETQYYQHTRAMTDLSRFRRQDLKTQRIARRPGGTLTSYADHRRLKTVLIVSASKHCVHPRPILLFRVALALCRTLSETLRALVSSWFFLIVPDSQPFLTTPCSEGAG